MKKSSKCKFLENCEFHNHDFSEIDENQPYNVRTEYLIVYCLGPLHLNCYRYQYMRKHGSPPEANVTPTGLIFKPQPRLLNPKPKSTCAS